MMQRKFKIKETFPEICSMGQIWTSVWLMYYQISEGVNIKNKLIGLLKRNLFNRSKMDYDIDVEESDCVKEYE